MVLRALVDNSAPPRWAQARAWRADGVMKEIGSTAELRDPTWDRCGGCEPAGERAGRRSPIGAAFRQERNLCSGSGGEQGRQSIEQAGDGGQGGQPVGRRGLALADLPRDVVGAQCPEAVLVGDVVTEVEHRLGAEL